MRRWAATCPTLGFEHLFNSKGRRQRCPNVLSARPLKLSTTSITTRGEGREEKKSAHSKSPPPALSLAKEGTGLLAEGGGRNGEIYLWCHSKYPLPNPPSSPHPPPEHLGNRLGRNTALFPLTYVRRYSGGGGGASFLSSTFSLPPLPPKFVRPSSREMFFAGGGGGGGGQKRHTCPSRRPRSPMATATRRDRSGGHPAPINNNDTSSSFLFPSIPWAPSLPPFRGASPTFSLLDILGDIGGVSFHARPGKKPLLGALAR